MSQRAMDSRYAIDSCTFQLSSWRPFQLSSAPKTLDSDAYRSSKPYYTSTGVQSKRPCRSDRATSFSIDAIDMSKLSLFDDERSVPVNKRESLSWIARKRRRRVSRSVSGRSSDKSRTRRCCSVGASAAYATCSDFPVAAGTDSSGEFFLNGDGNWASDVSEATKNSRKEKDGGTGERENLCSTFGQIGNYDNQGNDSGYGSEPGYRGDAELGYGDEVDEEDDGPRLLFWGDNFGDSDANMEIVGENTLQKTHHRCRRKKHDLKMVDPLR